MKLVNSFEEIATLISSQIKKGVLTNNFLNEEELKIEIKNNTLFYTLWNGGLFIFRDRGTHYILNYYICDLTKDYIEEYNKAVVVEIAYRDNDNKILEIINFFKKLGMNEYLNRIRLIKIDNNTAELTNNIVPCNIEDMEEILKLLNENFDVFSGCIPTKEMILNDIKNKNIFVCKNKKIEGIIHFNQSKLSSEIKHLVVKREFRNQKIAQSLIIRYIKEVNVKRKTVWTGCENNIAIGLYKKMGYNLDNYKSIVLLKK